MQIWPGTLLKKMVKAGEFSRKMETHLLLKRGIWFFFNTWSEQYQSNIVFDFFFLFHDANKDSQGGYVII